MSMIVTEIFDRIRDVKIRIKKSTQVSNTVNQETIIDMQYAQMASKKVGSLDSMEGIGASAGCGNPYSLILVDSQALHNLASLSSNIA